MKRSFESITAEATEYGCKVVVSTSGAVQFIDATGTIQAWMFKFPGCMWRGYSHDTELRTTGSKAKVADWCLDLAANGYAGQQVA